MKKLIPFLFAFLCLPAMAGGVKETAVTLPDNLGTAVLYTPRWAMKARPGVIVVHEWWGLNDYARSRARQLAAEGYPAIAVDMYGTGKVADHPDNAMAFMNAALAEPEKMNARFDAARAILEQQGKADSARIYAIGYCFGGAVVLNQARLGKDLAGVASFHGSLGTKTPAQAGTVKARVLVATGGADPMVPAEQVGAFMSEMTTAGVNVQLLSFPGVKHSFTNPGATAVGQQFNMPLAYDEAADRSSWAALLRMIRNKE
ncbi:MAG: dienelactone hydrolase family protein [Gammaproteobacteria bacterium]|nr:MAG: dienelactone hydrolase family protein [Gammaproteobacteria bacterium]